MYSYVTKIEKQKNNAKAQEQYNSILKSLTEEIRQRQHDFRNHLNIINGLAQVSDEREVKDKIKAYIGKLSNSMMDIEKIIYIDNTIIRAIIYSKFQEAKKKNIGFSYCITSSLDNMPLEEFQMSEILSNLIDNAFEAVESQEDQLIEVEIYEEEDNSVIEVRNSGITVQPGNVEKIFERGFSTKGGKGRGYGLYNVKRIVEGTGGSAQIYLEDNYTVFKLMIKNKKA
jgi:sensor histidine kinase regulating citrate/malate metabolism